MPLILTRSDIRSLITVEDVITVVEQAHADLANGIAVQPAPPALGYPGAETEFLPMTSVSQPLGLAGVKLLSDLPALRSRGLPSQRSTIMVVSAETGECEAVLEGRTITQFRTAAASAVATRHLSRPESRVLGLIGAGALAHTHLAAIRTVRPIDEVVVWSRTPERAAEFAAAHPDLTVHAAAHPQEATERADILCTLTPAKDPLVQGAWFRPGLHVNVVGAPPRADHREVDTEAVIRSHVVVDSVATTLAKSGDILVPLHEGAIDNTHFADELGEIVAGHKPGRSKQEEITLFNSVGLGLQDLATAHLLIGKARAAGIGTSVDLTA